MARDQSDGGLDDVLHGARMANAYRLRRDGGVLRRGR
jgi:hypothetical protein